MKLSELPVGTVVEFEEGHYEKRDNGDWYAMTGHCIDCMEDDVITAASMKGRPPRKGQIISVPYRVFLDLAALAAVGLDTTAEELAHEALKVNHTAEENERNA